jgi:hypothetical protein
VDLIAFVEQKLGQMKADEPGGSGNEYAFHGGELKIHIAAGWGWTAAGNSLSQAPPDARNPDFRLYKK